MQRAAQRQALPARAGIGEQNRQTPNPPFGARVPKVRAAARTCPVHAVLAAFLPEGIDERVIQIFVAT